MVLELTSQDELDNIRKIEVLVAPDGIHDLEYNVTKSKYEYLEEGWAVNDIQYLRKQYGLRHHVTLTINDAMGDTLIKVAMEISNYNGIFKPLD